MTDSLSDIVGARFLAAIDAETGPASAVVITPAQRDVFLRGVGEYPEDWEPAFARHGVFNYTTHVVDPFADVHQEGWLDLRSVPITLENE